MQSIILRDIFKPLTIFSKFLFHFVLDNKINDKISIQVRVTAKHGGDVRSKM
jgi:hypothetical protein